MTKKSAPIKKISKSTHKNPRRIKKTGPQKKNDKDQISFLGLDQILYSITLHTQKNYKGKKTPQQRMSAAKKHLIGPMPKDVITKKESDVGDKMAFFIAVAREVVKEIKKNKIEILNNKNLSADDKIDALSEVRDKIPMAKLVRPHIHLLKLGKNPDLVRNWVTNYNAQGRLYENEVFLESYDEKKEVANKMTTEALQEAVLQQQKAIAEITAVLKKHGWPI